jgi:hypothetical protein
MGVNAKTAALVLGFVFIIVGVLGYVPNPIVGPGGIFVTNQTHNLIHIASGIVLLLGAYSSLGSSLALKIIGVVYAVVAVLGFLMPGDMMLGMVAMNSADRWLHVALAIVILYAGFGLPAESKIAAA